ncbi:hypothetical protein CAPTEDRAFT_218063 [Capitella teleta]|uniref:Uncharacterized protein n=1 Tax=Capitella teleta TaxID=283909 RepID=R7U725_CAPTE|nr:hypothetical protein CAPTEDRAFT_218063 [Capitella teleta]|eukprot:ELT98935.1 hypothetical protein CAPTEDRAFT_218063 [Capitella teleta]
MASNPHWVEELFPPTFQLTAEEITEDDSVLKPFAESDKEPGDSIFKKLASRLSPLDPGSITNVYERAWLLEYLSKTGNIDATDPLLTQGSVCFNVGNTRDASTSTSDITFAESDCIWNSDEIQVLRTCFKSTSAETHKLKAQLKATQQELEALKTKHSSQILVTTKQNTALQEACKANHRLQILCDSLKKQNMSAENTIAELGDENKALKKTLRKYVKQNQTLEKDFELEKVQRAEIETTLALHHQESTRERMTHEASLKAKHQVLMEKIQQQLDETEQLLDQEKRDHDRTRKGLQHLQKHFSSFVNVDGSKDELKQWKYQS